MEPDEILVQSVGCSNLVKKLLDEFEVADIVDSAVPTDGEDWNLSPGTHVEALIINVLAHRNPLYRVEEAMATLDLAMLFGEKVMAKDFNDDALGRTLDVLAETRLDRLFGAVALNAASKAGVSVERVHADTTSVSVYGEYEDEGESLNVSRGYSKDRRPDLKQIMFGLMVSSEGYPRYGNVLDGNQDDKAWNNRIIRGIDGIRDEMEDMIYVADSSVVTKENLREIQRQKLRFISRLPGTFNVVNELKEKAWERDEWQKIGTLDQQCKGASYKLCTLPAEIDGTTYRCVVVSSSTLDQRREKKLNRILEEQRKQMSKALKELKRREFYCEPDAVAACERFRKKWSDALPEVELEVDSKTVPNRPVGRPKKGVPTPTRIFYAIEGELKEPDENRLQRIREKMATFVLITNVEELSEEEVLMEYKGQSSVEKRFRFLKDPVFVDGIYLKNQERIYALGFIFLFALLIASHIEYVVRRELETRDEIITAPGNRKQQRPTIVSLLDMLNTVQIAIHQTERGPVRKLSANLNPDVKRIIELLGYDTSIYTGPT